LFCFLQQNIRALQCLANTVDCEDIGTVGNHILGPFKGLLTFKTVEEKTTPPHSLLFVREHFCAIFIMTLLLDCSLHCKIMHCMTFQNNALHQLEIWCAKMHPSGQASALGTSEKNWVKRADNHHYMDSIIPGHIIVTITLLCVVIKFQSLYFDRYVCRRTKTHCG